MVRLIKEYQDILGTQWLIVNCLLETTVRNAIIFTVIVIWQLKVAAVNIFLKIKVV